MVLWGEKKWDDFQWGAVTFESRLRKYSQGYTTYHTIQYQYSGVKTIDISAYVLDISEIQKTTNYEITESRLSNTTVNITLSNKNNIFNPFNISGQVYYSTINLFANTTKYIIEIGWDGTEKKRMFTGKIKEWKETSDKKVQIELSDNLDIFFEKEIDTYVYGNRDIATIFWDILTNQMGLDNTQSTTNTDIDYATWLQSYNYVRDVKINGTLTGKKSSDILDDLMKYEFLSCIYCDNYNRLVLKIYRPNNEVSTRNIYIDLSSTTPDALNYSFEISKKDIYTQIQIINNNNTLVTKTANTALYGTKNKKIDILGNSTPIDLDNFAGRFLTKFSNPCYVLDATITNSVSGLLLNIGSVIMLFADKYVAQYPAGKRFQIYEISYNLMSFTTTFKGFDFSGVGLDKEYFILDVDRMDTEKVIF